MRKKVRIILLTVIVFIVLLKIAPAFAWETERPSAYLEINDREDNAGSDDEASVGLGVDIFEYKENSPVAPFGDGDGIIFRAIATANTRKAITYGQTVFTGLIDWVEAVDPTGITGDDSGAWFTLPFPVRFYGGPGYPYKSAEYSSVWVSSNGFLSFDSESTSSNPEPIPDPASPNTLFAVYWSDLDPNGGSIKYYGDSTIFVILWDNVLDKRNGIRQTFEVIIENFQVPGGGRGQNRIKFLYESVTWSSDSIAGIEDQEGCKGTMPSPFPQSGQGVMFTALKEAPEIKRITIKLQKPDAEAIILIDQNYWSLQGHNVKLESLATDSSLFERAVKGYGSLLVSTALKAILGVSTVGGLIISGTLVTIPLAFEYVRSLSPLNVPEAEIQDAYESDTLAYVTASADTLSSWGWPVDAAVGIQVFWVFNDANTIDHSVTITAELEYYSYTSFSEVTLQSNPVTLTMYDEVGPKQISVPASVTGSLGVDDSEDLWKFHVTIDPLLSVTMIPPSDADFDLELLDSSGNVLAHSRNRGLGLIENLSYNIVTSGDYYVKVIWYSGDGFYNLELEWTSNPGGGGGGGGGGGWGGPYPLPY